MEPGQEVSTIRVVGRALRLLTVAAERPAGIGLADAARHVGLAPSTTHRILRALETAEFVRRDDDGLFHAGSELVRLGALHTSQTALADLAQPHLDALAESTGESCYLAIAANDDAAIYVRYAPSPHALRHVSWLGRQLPRAGTAVGAALEGRCSRLGVAVVRDGVELGTTAVARPVQVHGQVLGVLSVVGPSFRIGAARQRAITTALTAAVEAIERGL